MTGFVSRSYPKPICEKAELWPEVTTARWFKVKSLVAHFWSPAYLAWEGAHTTLVAWRSFCCSISANGPRAHWPQPALADTIDTKRVPGWSLFWLCPGVKFKGSALCLDMYPPRAPVNHRNLWAQSESVTRLEAGFPWLLPNVEFI